MTWLLCAVVAVGTVLAWVYQLSVVEHLARLLMLHDQLDPIRARDLAVEWMACGRWWRAVLLEPVRRGWLAPR